MEPSDLLQVLTQTLDKLGICYAIVGSMASGFYGEPRLTLDIDVLLALEARDIDKFCAEFPAPDYYLSRAAVESAVQKRFQFNIIHPSSGLKVDCFVASGGFDDSQLARSLAVFPDGQPTAMRLASPEDVIIKKLEYFQIGESEKHVRDICGILKLQGERIDHDYIQHWVRQKNLEEIWQAVLVRLETRP